MVVCSHIFILDIGLPRRANTPLSENKALSTRGVLVGFLADISVNLSNPKALLFYMGMLSGFFVLRSLTLTDIGVILVVSTVIPMGGNIALAVLIERASGIFTLHHLWAK